MASSMNTSKPIPPIPSRASNAPAPAPDPTHMPTLFTAPCRTKVLELPDGLRVRADATAQALSRSLEYGAGNAALQRITQLRQESPIRRPPSDPSSWGTITVEKRQQRQQRQTAPANARIKSLRPPARLAISAPVIPKTGDTFDSLIRLSPAGNAWNGHHYWKPQFSDSVPGSPSGSIKRQHKFMYSDPARRAMYESTLANVALCVREIRGEAQQDGDSITGAEAEVVAAMTVLDEKNQMYEAQYTFPLPKDVHARAKEFQNAQVKILEEYTVQDEAELNDSNKWLHVKRGGKDISVVLDHTKVGLRMIRERRKSAETEIFGAAYGLACAVQVLEEKVRKLKDKESAEDSSDEEMEYGKFLKSIREELGLVQDGWSLRERQVSEGRPEMRRLKGKAPSATDLEAWASELKALENRQRNADFDFEFL